MTIRRSRLLHARSGLDTHDRLRGGPPEGAQGHPRPAYHYQQRSYEHRPRGALDPEDHRRVDERIVEGGHLQHLEEPRGERLVGARRTLELCRQEGFTPRFAIEGGEIYVPSAFQG
jgi:hypothetical protein